MGRHAISSAAIISAKFIRRDRTNVLLSRRAASFANNLATWPDFRRSNPREAPTRQNHVSRIVAASPGGSLVGLKLGHVARQNGHMDSDQITAEQASQLYAALFRHVNYLLRLKKRMEDLRFPDDDPLYVAATAAYYGGSVSKFTAYQLKWDAVTTFDRPPGRSATMPLCDFNSVCGRCSPWSRSRRSPARG
jgi:hypothetical protein